MTTKRTWTIYNLSNSRSGLSIVNYTNEDGFSSWGQADAWLTKHNKHHPSVVITSLGWDKAVAKYVA